MANNLKLQSIMLIIGVVLISNFQTFAQVDGNYEENQKKAYAARTVEECQYSLQFCNMALKQVPNHPVLYYMAARLNAQIGNNDLALTQLKKATELGYNTKMLFNEIHHLNDSAFFAFKDNETFIEIIKALEKTENPVHRSEIAITIKDKELNPEGICYDSVEKMFYLGSINKQKIIKVDSSGKSTDFTKEGQDGLHTVLGIHIDPVRRMLWAVSCSEERSEIYKYNLSSGELIKKYFLSPLPNGKKRFFNDLLIHPNGDIYITGGNSIYTISQSSDKLERFLTDKSFFGFNGITHSDNEQIIFVSDYYIGIYKIDIKTKSFALLTHEPEFNLFGVDGLYFLNNQLYAVQDGINTIDKFSLNEDATHIKSCEIFERNTPYLYFPTTGVLVDDHFYFIADTQANAYKQEGVIIMRVSIK